MKKYVMLILTIFSIWILGGCGKDEAPNFTTFEAKILEIREASFLVEPVEGSQELKSADQISVPMKNMDPSLEPEVGDIIEIAYNGEIMETYPAQIGEVYSIKVTEEAEHWDLNPMVMVNGELYLATGYESTVDGRCGMMDGEITSTVEGWEKPTEDDQSNFGSGYSYQYGSTEGTIEIYINEKWWIYATEEAKQELQFPEISDSDEIITYNGKEYKKSELSEQTLNWLELSEEERMLSSYYPPELMEIEEIWGIILSVKDITPMGLTCTQTGGEPTGELQTGSWYILEKWTQKNGWKEVEWQPQKYDVAWTDEAWIIPKEDTAEWDVDWEWLYGKLSAGSYRIGKSIMDFRETGDYDTQIYYAEFEIQ